MNDVVPNTIDIPGYRILRKLGYGGMATVYLAEEARLGRLVALKIMSEDLSQGSNFTERFIAEGKMAAGLHHPNIVTVYNMGVAGDHYFISMEYIDGEPLSVRIKSDIPPEFAVRTAKRMAGALASAHARGILHRDVKPSNILFRENRFAVLADFGIAKALESDSELTLTGRVLGTPSYMSPQQASGQKIDHRSDLYSLGVVLFEMLASKRPFVGDTPISTALKHVTDPIPKLPQPVAHFQPIIDRVLAKSTEDRFQDTEEFIQALDAIQIGEAPPSGGRVTMVSDKDVVQSLPETSPDCSSGIESPPHDTTGKVPLAGKLEQLINGFSRIKHQLAAVTGLILLVLVTGKFIDWKTERDFQRRTEINELSVQAKEHMAESRFIEPEGNNAVAAYRKILELDTDNVLAINGLDAIEKKLEQEVADGRVNEGPKQALSHVEDALHAFPDSPTLNRLRASNEKKLAVREPEFRIATLMEKANQQELELQLTEPEGDNAYVTFREILRLDPDNAEARQGLNRIVARYQVWAQDSKQSGDLPKALDMAEKGLRIAPENSDLLTFRSNIQQTLDLESSIVESLGQAEQRIERGHLLEPKDDNAYAAVARVLERDSENTEALKLQRKIEAMYLNRVTEQHRVLRRSLALAHLFPENQQLAQLAEQTRGELTIAELLQSADSSLRESPFSTSSGIRAYAAYSKVLLLDPGNHAADGGFRKIVKKIAALATDQKNAGKRQQALETVKLGLQGYPANAKLRDLHDKLKKMWPKAERKRKSRHF